MALFGSPLMRWVGSAICMSLVGIQKEEEGSVAGLACHLVPAASFRLLISISAVGPVRPCAPVMSS